MDYHGGNSRSCGAGATEVIMICVDNSKWEGAPSERFDFQKHVFRQIHLAKQKQNPCNFIGLSTMCGHKYQKSLPPLLASPYDPPLRMLSGYNGMPIYRDIDIRRAIRVAVTACASIIVPFKHVKLRIVMFLGGPIKENMDTLSKIAKRMKERTVALDVINFGEEDQARIEKLGAFVAAVNHNDNSHILHAPPGSSVNLNDLFEKPLLSSPIVDRQEMKKRREEVSKSNRVIITNGVRKLRIESQ